MRVGRRQPTSNPRAPQTFAYYERIPPTGRWLPPPRNSEKIDAFTKEVVALLTGLPTVFPRSLPAVLLEVLSGAFFAKNSAHKIAFLTGSGPKREVIVNKGLNPV
jgi:hypothetical protein